MNAERFVVDTNVLISAALKPSGVPRAVVDTIRHANGVLLFSDLLLSAGADVDESAPDGIGGNTNARSRYVPDTDAAALLVAIDSGHAELACWRGAPTPTTTGRGAPPCTPRFSGRCPRWWRRSSSTAPTPTPG